MFREHRTERSGARCREEAGGLRGVPPQKFRGLVLLSFALSGCWHAYAEGGDASVPMLDMCSPESTPAEPIDSVPPGAWTAIVLPDTQIYAESRPDIFQMQTEWILANRDALNIQFVLHVGDIVDDNNQTAQWDVAYTALHALDGVVPYVLTPGNHDLGTGLAENRDTLLDTYFPLSTFQAWPSFGGVFAPGSIANNYHVFSTPTGEWLVVALEFGPRDEVVAWANEVIRAHAPMPAIVVTHAYLYSDNTRYDFLLRPEQMWNPHSYGLAMSPGGVNDGEEMFQAFVRSNDSVDLVICGHVLNDGLGRSTSVQAGGGRVHEVLANYQHCPEGGLGFLRVMTFRADGSAVDVRTYSPYLDEQKIDPENRFTLLL